MDQTVEEFDSASGAWVTPAADVVADTPASDLEETPVPDQPDVNAAEAKADAKADKIEAKPKPRNDPRARVEAATAKEAEAKRERDAAKAESAKLQARIAELEARTAPKPQPKPQADAEPTVDQFDSYEKFVKAQARWEARQEIRQQDSQREQIAAYKQQADAEAEVERNFGERYSAVLAADPDFPTKVDPRLLNTPRVGVLADKSQATFGNFLVEQVFQSEHPKELLLHLSNPAEVQRLATLPPALVIRELARFEGRLDAASPSGPASKTPAVSHAKAPIRPVVGSPLVSTDEPGEDASDDEWMRHYQASELRKRRAGRG